MAGQYEVLTSGVKGQRSKTTYRTWLARGPPGGGSGADRYPVIVCVDISNNRVFG